jgi:hypothetical protein
MSNSNWWDRIEYRPFTKREVEQALLDAGIDPDASTWSEATLRRAEDVLDALENQRKQQRRKRRRLPCLC